MKARLFRDRQDVKVFRVEAIDPDGGCEVAVFAGPMALERALAFLDSDFYDEWEDPEDLSSAGTPPDESL